MIANHIHDALAQVRRLQEFILERGSFRGYSGSARIIGGFVALGGAMILDSGKISDTPQSHLVGWGIVLAVGLAVNYVGLALWFMRDPKARGDVTNLMPAIDAIPPLAIGAVLSLAVILRQQYDFLFGIWMCLYGVVHAAYRRSLPKENYFIGVFYMISGTACLFLPQVSFTNPWPMGLVFFIGETLGGFVLYRNNWAGAGHPIEKGREREQDD